MLSPIHRPRGCRTPLAAVLTLAFAALSLRCGGGSSAGASPPPDAGHPADSSIDSAPAPRDAGPDSPIDSTTADSGPACIPGTSISCAGPLSCPGYQVCDASGTGFDPCNCSGGDSGAPPGDAGSDAPADAPVTGPAVLHGAIQKGPFILGSSVTLASIDATGASTGQVFTTQTTTDLGDFAVTFAYRGYVDMQAQGFYYDEVTGALSTAPITLRALYDVTTGGAQSAYINIVTHLARDRALSLMAGGAMTLEAAEAQAEGELVTALGIGGTGFNPGGAGIGLNELGANDDANAYLFAVSAVLVQAAIEQAGDAGAVDAQVQELVDTIASNLVAAGTLPPALIARLRTAEQDLDVDLTMDLFYYRLQAIGSSATPADLNRAIDSDGDGYRNLVDTCPLVANANQAVVPAGVLCKVTRRTTFLAAPAYGPLLGDFENTGHPGMFEGLPAGLGVLIGDGSGRFSNGRTMPDITGLIVTMAVDANHDGNVDLAGPWGWAAGDGAGHFGSVITFPDPIVGLDGGGPPPTPYYEGLAAADFNGDGLVDIARAAFVSSSTGAGVGLAVCLATGSGSFAPAQLFGLPAGMNSNLYPLVLAGDVNGDGTPDLVIVWTSSIATYLGDGTGGFQMQAGVSFGATAPVGTPWLADVDGDGHLDVLSQGGGASPSVIVAFGDGSGLFGSVTRTSLNISTWGQLVAGDFNADGKTDIVALVADAASYKLADIDVLLSQGRTFASPQRLRTSSIDVNSGVPWGLATGDVNGDGVPDAVLVSGATGGQWTVQSVLMNTQQ